MHAEREIKTEILVAVRMLGNSQSITSSFHLGMALLYVTEILEIIFSTFLEKYIKENNGFLTSLTAKNTKHLAPSM
jgi:hypothetical protein